MVASYRNRWSRRAIVEDPNAFPSQQLFVLALCRICEPIAFMSIFPYIYFMIQSFKITEDKTQIAIYASLVTSAFTFAEFSSGVFWGRLSDRVGRKPVLLTGLAGTGLSTLVFGFAPNLPVALLARALGGLLNGNIGVLQTTVAEVVTVKAHQPRAYSIMPFVWCLGSIIGSGLGGTLSDPVKHYPSVFQPGSIFERFPYLLPNLVCTAVVCMGLVVGILFLEETHEEKKFRRDPGLELGGWILRKLCRTASSEKEYEKIGYFEETLSFLVEDNEILQGYAQPEALPHDGSTEAAPLLPPAKNELRHTEPAAKLPISRVFTKQIILNIVAYGILALHTISLELLIPVLLARPTSAERPVLPFKFDGGLSLDAKQIGLILSVQGFLQMIAQIFVFPVVNSKLGSLTTFRLAIFAYPIMYFIAPYLVLLPENMRVFGVYAVLVWKVTGQSLSYPSAAIMLANMAPSKKVLGTLNGSASSSASLCRSIGPVFSGMLQFAGERTGYSGLAWWACACVAILGAVESLWMTEEKGSTDLAGDEESVIDVDADQIGAPAHAPAAPNTQPSLPQPCKEG